MNFGEWVGQYPSMTPHGLAKKALAEDPEMLLPAIAREIEHIRRGGLRDEERLAVARFIEAVANVP